jgi:hypothetical protein
LLNSEKNGFLNYFPLQFYKKYQNEWCGEKDCKLCMRKYKEILGLMSFNFVLPQRAEFVKNFIEALNEKLLF